MAFTLEQVNANVTRFNRKYNFNFDVNDFSTKGNESGWDKTYWDTYMDFATALANRKVAGENLPSLHEMLQDYEDIVMGSLRRYSVDNNLQSPKIYGGVNSTKNRAALMQAAFEKVPTRDYQLIAKNYMDGKLRIRDMVALTKKAVESDKPLKREMAVELLKYSLALEHANRNRPSLYWLFHPFRNRAEQRDAARIKEMVAKKVGDLGITRLLKEAKNDIVLPLQKDIEAINFQLKDMGTENELIFDEDIKSLHFNDSVFYEDDKIVETTKDKQMRLEGEENEAVEKLSGRENEKIKEKVLKSKESLEEELGRNQDNIIAMDDFEEEKDLFKDELEKDFSAESIQKEIDKRFYGDDVLGSEDIADYDPNKGFMDEINVTEEEMLRESIQVANPASNEQEIERANLLISEDEKVAPSKANEVKEQPKPVVAPKNPAIDNPFLKIGYRPDISSKGKMNEQGRYLKNLERDMRHNWGKYSKAENEVYQVNRKRYESAFGRFAMGSGNQNVFASDKEELYAMQDNELREKFPEYKLDVNQKGMVEGNEERVPIKVDLGENKIQEKSNSVGGESIKIEPPISSK